MSRLLRKQERMLRGGTGTHTHLPKIIKNQPGLATIKCSMCGAVGLVEYSDRAEYERLRETIRQMWKPKDPLRLGLAT